MKLLLGIPTHKRPELLRECLASIAAQEGALPDIEVFVADNDPAGRQGVGVAEDLVPGYRFPLSATTVDEPGISAVRNAILDEARRREVDFIAMIDDDETASPEWIKNLLKAQDSYEADIVGGRVEPVFSVPPEPGALIYWTPKPKREGIVDRINGTGNCLISIQEMVRLNWPRFDSAFGLTGGGDEEWFRRIERRGSVFAWSEMAVTREAVSPERSTDAWVLRRAFRAANSSTRIFIRHRRWGKLLGFLARDLALCASPRRFRVGLAYVRGRLSALCGLKVQEYAERHQES